MIKFTFLLSFFATRNLKEGSIFIAQHVYFFYIGYSIWTQERTICEAMIMLVPGSFYGIRIYRQFLADMYNNISFAFRLIFSTISNLRQIKIRNRPLAIQILYRVFFCYLLSYIRKEKRFYMMHMEMLNVNFWSWTLSEIQKNQRREINVQIKKSFFSNVSTTISPRIPVQNPLQKSSLYKQIEIKLSKFAGLTMHYITQTKYVHDATNSYITPLQQLLGEALISHLNKCLAYRLCQSKIETIFLLLEQIVK